MLKGASSPGFVFQVPFAGCVTLWIYFSGTSTSFSVKWRCNTGELVHVKCLQPCLAQMLAAAADLAVFLCCCM